MKFVTDHTVGGGTSLQGYLNVPFSRVVEAFGEPSEGDGYKVAFEWGVRFEDGTVATIYDYKASSLYDEGEPTPEWMRENDYSDWHVGGNSKRAAELVNEIFAEKEQPDWADYGRGLSRYGAAMAYINDYRSSFGRLPF
jgi:hypothetical protein